MTVDTIEPVPGADDHSVSTESQVTDDPDLKESNSGRSSSGESSLSSDEASKFVKKETRHVFFLRMIVLSVLFAASASISLVVYFVTSAGEQDTFESQYEAAANKVTDAFVHIVDQKMEAAGSLVVAMVAHGVDHKRSWPFIALSSFQQRSSTVRGLSGALYLGFMPKVTHEIREAWENYTMHDGDNYWYGEGREYQKEVGIDDLDNRPQLRTDDPNLHLDSGIANYIYDFDNSGEVGKGLISPRADIYLPTWQTSPVTQRSVVNENFAGKSEAALSCLKYHEVTFDHMQYSRPGYGSDDDPNTAEIAWLLRMATGDREVRYEGDIYSSVYFPVYSSFDESTRESVAVMRAVIHWAQYFKDILPDTTEGLVVVLENGCDQPFTYQINGESVIPLGHGDLHDTKFDEYMRTATFADVQTINDGTKGRMKVHYDKCAYMIRTYPSDHMVNLFTTSTPVVITAAVAIVFLFAVLMFFVYDRMVERRQRILMEKAKKTHQIVASLFPKNIRDQILNDDGELRQNGVLGAKNTLKSFVNGGMENQIFGQMPIADLYPEATVMFADIAGFTSWSSSREPAQVFVLLQTLYGAFDEIAKKRHVFKVETIGDSYVACAGVPEADAAHAVKMARFAYDCMIKMSEITKDLETQLGPDTGELSMRFGLNSGPVTAGLLRGDRSRFQLFGDTVNTAARMESTGVRGKIQCSQSTADALMRSGKDHWLAEREDLVSAKGKGIMRTFWLTPSVDRANTANSQDTEEEEDVLAIDFAGKLASQLLKREREVEWVSELIHDSVREIVAQRATRKGKIAKSLDALPNHRARNRVPIDEVVDVIKMPNFDSKNSADNVQSYAIKVPENVSRLIREYVSIIAAAYKKNPFHNFEHACHVTMCVSKLLKRIVNPEMSDNELAKMKDAKKLNQHLHTYTHGINSDPITLFAILFSAIIHDVDHPGVSNKQFSAEHPLLGEKYHNKSVAEQNSLDVAWDVLMDSHFREMREYIFETSEELSRFRQIVVNTVLATDIFDPELNQLRKQRWSRAFSESQTGATASDINDARATVVIEHIMQASDVCHTMQHWHVYTRHNKNLFEEILLAYRQGRCAANPAEFWYEGELKFFDNYIIPLAQKLKECNIFGVSSDECLNYALRNRDEWEDRGRAMVAEYVQAFDNHEMVFGRRQVTSSSFGEEEKTEEGI